MSTCTQIPGITHHLYSFFDKIQQAEHLLIPSKESLKAYHPICINIDLNKQNNQVCPHHEQVVELAEKNLEEVRGRTQHALRLARVFIKNQLDRGINTCFFISAVNLRLTQYNKFYIRKLKVLLRNRCEDGKLNALINEIQELVHFFINYLEKLFKDRMFYCANILSYLSQTDLKVLTIVNRSWRVVVVEQRNIPLVRENFFVLKRLTYPVLSQNLDLKDKFEQFESDVLLLSNISNWKYKNILKINSDFFKHLLVFFKNIDYFELASFNISLFTKEYDVQVADVMQQALTYHLIKSKSILLHTHPHILISETFVRVLSNHFRSSVIRVSLWIDENQLSPMTINYLRGVKGLRLFVCKDYLA